MIPLKRLYLVAGFGDSDVERRVSELQRSYASGTVRFLARPYPVQRDKQSGYLRALVQSANDVIFGSGTATNFCRRQDQPCAADLGKEKKGRRTCEVEKGAETGCARARPQLIVVICADRLFDEALDRLGRGTLILRLPGPLLPSQAELKAAVDAFEPIGAEVVRTISNRSKSLYAPLLPDRNFQRLGGHPVARAAQDDPARFAAVLDQYHAELYRSDFVNPKKPKVRGAYMLDAETAFQQDHLHKVVQNISAESRRDAFHLLNAYHVYGVKSDPGFHFDVMNSRGESIRHILGDILTGNQTNGAEDHLNATPCDRLL